MNIWKLDKDQSIRHLLLLLEAQLGRDGFVIDTLTETDPCALFLHHPDDAGVRAYLYTLGQAPGRYGVHLEYPPSSSSPSLFDAQENVALPTLVELLAVHFDIACVHPLPGR